MVVIVSVIPGTCHPDIYKTALSIDIVFHILIAIINSQVASIFQKNPTLQMVASEHNFVT